MLKVLDAILLSTDYLQKKGIDEPRLNAELLLADVLNFKRLNLYLNYDRPLTEKEKDTYRSYLTRRANYEPLQYVLGYTEFYSLHFFVNKNVLIPRPDTEILVETVINENKSKTEKLKVLDIGTGSGIIAISLALNMNCEVTAIDISEEALEVAKLNAEYHNVLDKINFRRVDILNCNSENLGNYDIIASNPPYVSKDDFKTLQKEILDYEPNIAVTDHDSGFSFYNSISKLSPKILNNLGKVYFEIGKGQELNVSNLLKESGYNKIKQVKDYSNIIRVVSGEF